MNMPLSPTTTVRLRRNDSERLAALAKLRETTVVDVLHQAIAALEREEFLTGLDEDYLRLSPAQREELAAERQLWDEMV